MFYILIAYIIDLSTKEGDDRKQVEIQVDELLYTFYRKMGLQVGKSPEQVMADALFRFAGDAAQGVLHSRKTRRR